MVLFSNYISGKISLSEKRMSKDTNTTIDTKIDQHLQSHLINIKETNQRYDMQHFTSKQEKLQRCLTRLKDGTKQMFQQTKSDYNLITDRVHLLEGEFKLLKSNMSK